MASNKSKVISLSLAQAILMIVNVTSGMVFSRTLSVADYGTYLQTFLAYDFAAPVLTLGLPTALYYFLPRETTRQKGLVLENLLLLFFTGIIFSVFLIFGGAELLAKRFNNPHLAETMRWMIFYPLFTFPIVLSPVLVLKDKTKQNAIYSVVTGIILSLSLISAAIFTKSYTFPIIFRILIPLLFFPIATYYTFKYLPGSFSRPSIKSMLNIVKFSIPLGLSSMLGTITLQISNIIVSSLCSPHDFAIYANGAREVPFVGIITGSISVVIMAEMSVKIKEGSLSEALKLFRKASKLSALFLLPIMAFLLFYASDFINFMYTSKYADSVFPFTAYLFFLPIRIVFYGSIFMALGKTKLVFYRSIVDTILTTLLCYIFVKYFGFYGAVFAPLITLYLWTVPYNLFTIGKNFNCSAINVLPLKEIGKILLVSLISASLVSFILIFNFSSFFKLMLGGILFSAIYMIIAYNYLLDFRELVDSRFNFNKSKQK